MTCKLQTSQRLTSTVVMAPGSVKSALWKKTADLNFALRINFNMTRKLWVSKAEIPFNKLKLLSAPEARLTLYLKAMPSTVNAEKHPGPPRTGS